MAYKIKFLIFALIVSLGNKGFAQQWQIDHFTIADGLAQSSVNVLFQDKEGFLWIGCQDGLNKYDGYNFKKYIHIPFDTTSLSNNWIYDILEDNKNNIWIATRNGLNQYNKITNTFTTYRNYQNSNSLYSDAIYGIAIDSNGWLYINTPPVLNIFKPEQNRLLQFENYIGNSTAIEEQRLPVLCAKDGKVWISTIEGLACFDNKLLKFDNYTYKNTEGFTATTKIGAIYEDDKQNILVGCQSGLYFYNKINTKLERIDFNFYDNNNTVRNFIRSIEKDNNNYFWIGTERGGLYRVQIDFNKKSIPYFEHFYPQTGVANSIANDIVFSLHKDFSDNLWIGTLNGLDKINRKAKKFQLYRNSNTFRPVNLLDNVIASVYKENEDIIWIGNWGSGLNKFNRKTWQVEHFTSTLRGNNNILNDFVHVIFNDSKNRLWIGTRNGINIYDKATKKMFSLASYFKTSVLPDFQNNRVYCIVEDHKNLIWIGTINGLYIINPITLDWTLYQQGTTSDEKHISGNLIYCMLQSKNKNIFVGTTNGLDIYNYEKGNFSHISYDEKNPDGISDNFIVSMLEDKNGDMWIGTKSGLNKYEIIQNKFTHFTEADGLQSNIIYEMIEDKHENLWLSTGKGLIKFNKKDKTFYNYSIADGLQSMEFNIRASYKSTDGELFFGGMNGLNAFYPDSISGNKFIPPVHFTNISVTNNNGLRNINPFGLKEIILTHKDFYINLEFAAMDLTYPSENRYKYKMTGLSENWTPLGSRTFLSFYHLPAGTYFLNIIASNPDGYWNEKGITIKIIVKPPWWRSNMAYICYVLILLIAVYSIVRIREKNLKKTKRILEMKVKQRTEEIAAQRDEIIKQKNIAEEQRDQISKQKTAITESIRYARRIQEAMLPAENYLKQYVNDCFIFYKPRDIVSGDFYWYRYINKKLYIIAADCTGHGVPGAMMSMLSIAFINEIFSNQFINQPSDLLEELREKVINYLQKNNTKEEIKDSLDIASIIIDTEEKTLQYAGAYVPLYIFQNGLLTEIKADRKTIGRARKESTPFTSHTFSYASNTTVYMFSDGFYSQLRNDKGCYLSKNFKNLLNRIHTLPMEDQSSALANELEQWQGDNEQTDDILIIGIKL